MKPAPGSSAEQVRRLPQPFSTITVRFGKPISVGEGTFEKEMSELGNALQVGASAPVR